jgi:hypothetical protein
MAASAMTPQFRQEPHLCSISRLAAETLNLGRDANFLVAARLATGLSA